MKNTFNPFLVFAIFALVFILNLPQSEAGPVRIKTGLRYAPDTNECEGPRGLCFAVLLKNPITIDNSGIAEISIDGESIVITLLEDYSNPDDDENTFTVYTPKELAKEVCEELGVQNIVLKPGVYRVDKSRHRLGAITIPAEIID
jgi:hypothetical protein